MKTILLALLGLCLHISLAAQTDYRVGVVPLDSIRGQYLQMNLITCYQNGRLELHIQLYHALPVPRSRPTTRPHATQGVLDTYILKNAQQEWVSVSNYIAALDLMYRLGWELYGDPPRSESAPCMLKRHPASSRD